MELNSIYSILGINSAVAKQEASESSIQAINGLTTSPLKETLAKAAKHSLYTVPLDIENPERLSGNSRLWGDAPIDTQISVISRILTESQDLTFTDQVILVGIAKVESGFNPDAAAKSTSAAGVFQLVRDTARALGVEPGEIFNAEENIRAGVSLYRQNLKLIERRYPSLTECERAIMLYALHHDGPSLKYGGAEIAKRELIPRLKEMAAQLQTLFN